ncbi:LysM domain-containing GPI-anchored protein 1 [Dichanthelium oligosanthes]|uniref:LysM domain-containing GPI-anchored protein 1 n=1 Tax=Dichanthelium oligosanthes TaxID=888268 RepID=A0A1E5WAC1_9POAL|nr:LysM domain-containing GPI-anchored protein 1 [Dichanthelium oligosanthes]
MPTPVATLLVILAVVMMFCSDTAKTMIEPFSGVNACLVLLGYTLYKNMKVSEVAALFSADPIVVLAANALDFAFPGSAIRILPAGTPLRVPTHCSCTDDVHKSITVRYATLPMDMLDSVANSVFVGLPSADQIRTSNGLTEEDPDAPLNLGRGSSSHSPAST